MKLIASLAVTTAGLVAISAQAQSEITASTTPVGAVEVNLPAGQTIFSPLFVNASEFQGVGNLAQDPSGETTTITFDNADFSGVDFSEGDYPRFYAETVGGDNEGFGLDIVSNTDDSITVAGAAIDDLGLNASETFVIRRHITLGQLFENAEGVAGTPVAILFDTSPSGEVFFLSNGSWVASDFSTPADDRQIYPNTGIVTQFNSPVEVVTTGTVKTTSTRLPVIPGNVILAASGSPVDEQVGDLEIDSDLNQNDQFVFLQDGTLELDTLLFWDGSKFTSNFADDDGDSPVVAGRAFVYNSNTEKYLNFAPAYTE